MNNYLMAINSNPNYLNGKRFGKLVVQCFDHKDKKYGNTWKCLCDCENIIYVPTRKLMSGNTKSCGCLRNKLSGERNLKDLTGQRFGQLVVLFRNGSDKHGRALWLCRCDCGTTKTASSNDLLRGLVKSCGCIKSSGEKEIKCFLQKQGIIYYTEYSFNNCREKKPLRFDFYLPEIGPNGACIEFDGVQHYIESRLYSKSITLETRQRRDRIKNEYCKNNNIPLLRIPYWDQDNIESILSEWLNIYDAEDANSSDVAL